MDDFFRSFFGLNRRNPFGPPSDSHGSADSFLGDDDEDDSEDHRMRENPFPGEGFSFHSPDGAFTFNFQFDQPDQIFRHFEEMFKNIGLSEFPTLPPVGPGPSGALPAPEPSNPRDEMLKEPGGQPGPGGQHRPRTPTFGDQWKMPRWNRQDPQDKTDTDLDEEVKKRGLEPFLSTPKESDLRPQRPQTNFSFSSVSVRTVQGPDGSVEEHRTVQDSTGREETTVRRIMGDRSHSVTTKTDKEGNIEKIEDYKNIDDKNLGTFDHAWSQRPSFGRGPPHQLLPEQREPVDAQTQSIFSKLFGFNFPRFGGS